MTAVELSEHAIGRGLIRPEQVAIIIDQKLGRWIYDKRSKKLLIFIDAIVIVLVRETECWKVVTVYKNHGKRELSTGRYIEVSKDTLKKLSDADEE